MEKEKISKQLEEKLLPSVQNLDKGQATEYDFFPALLWMLLEKNKDAEKSLSNIDLKHSKELEKAATTIIENNQENKKIYEELITKAVNFIVSNNQESHKKIESIKNWFFVSLAFQVITLIVLAIIILRK